MLLHLCFEHLISIFQTDYNIHAVVHFQANCTVLLVKLKWSLKMIRGNSLKFTICETTPNNVCYKTEVSGYAALAKGSKTNAIYVILLGTSFTLSSWKAARGSVVTRISTNYSWHRRFRVKVASMFVEC